MEIINWQEDDIKDVLLIDPIFRRQLVKPKETYHLGSRGSFKTSQGIAFYLADCIYEMPGSSGTITGPSFEHLMDNTINPVFNSLAKYGLVQDVHYVICQPPPKEWPKPYTRVPTKKYDHIITWHNGANDYLISMAKKGSANGISCQRGIFDEVKLLDQKELKEIVFPAFRGNETYFSGHPLYLSKYFATDKLADIASIKWLLDKEAHNDYKKFDVIITLQLELNRLQLDYNDAGVNKRQALKPQIYAIETRLALLRQNLSMYIETSAKDSKLILGQAWYDDKVANSTPYVKRIAYDNENPDRPEDGFYPDFEPGHHTHQLAGDIDITKPLIISADYQHSISPICICQLAKLPGASKISLNYVDEVYTLAPDGLEEAVQKFCEKYKYHQCKNVYYIYDATATGKRVNADKYFKIVKDVLYANRWAVIDVYTGKQPGHYQKWVDQKAWFKNELGTHYDIMINARCEKLIKSLMMAPAKISGGKTVKDKKYEDTNNYPSFDQSETTHFSDVFDMVNHATLKLKKIPAGWGSSTSIAFR